MNIAAYDTWVELFDDEVSEIWRYERYELRKSAMLMTALRKELKSVYNNVENYLKKLRQQLDHKDTLEEMNKLSTEYKKTSPEIKDKENMRIPIMKSDLNSTVNSPDLFKVIDQNIFNSSSTIIDLSLSDDNLAMNKTECSPPLNKRKKKFKHQKINKSINSVDEDLIFKRDIFESKKSDANESVIAGTPENYSKPIISKILKKVKKNKNATLTQMFPNVSNPSKIDAEDGVDSDETRIDDRVTQGLTEILDCMNGHVEMADRNKIYLKNDSFSNDSEIYSPKSDAFSNAALFNDSDIASPQEVPIKRQKVEAEPVVRGKARKLLTGFSCQQCRDFYSIMDLTPEELQKKMDACSRHRYMYKPPPDTMPGFWDLTVSSQATAKNYDQ